MWIELRFSGRGASDAWHLAPGWEQLHGLFHDENFFQVGITFLQ